uniref:Uncharacterized protein n=1 Tax=Glossina palpalis gambiensis TaxID=67801 RepID=A0A1B0AWB2_9MUSC
MEMHLHTQRVPIPIPRAEHMQIINRKVRGPKQTCDLVAKFLLKISHMEKEVPREWTAFKEMVRNADRKTLTVNFVGDGKPGELSTLRLYASNYIQKLKTKQLKFAITVNFRIYHQTIYVYASNERCDRICVSRWLQKAAPFSVLLSSTLQILKEFRPFIAAFGATPLQGIAMESIVTSSTLYISFISFAGSGCLAFLLKCAGCRFCLSVGIASTVSIVLFCQVNWPVSYDLFVSSALYFHRALLFNTRMKEDVIRYVDASVICNEELTCSAYPIWVWQSSYLIPVSKVFASKANPSQLYIKYSKKLGCTT